jgi:glycosyltransferase 2 family protein
VRLLEARMRIRTVVVVLLAIALLAWFLQHADLAAVWGHVRSARVDYLFVAAVCVALSYWIRAMRWRHLLSPIGPARFRTVLRTTVIGFAALGVLPARAGDLLRPYLLARREGLRASAVFATIVIERVLDLITVLGLLAVYVWGFADPQSLPPSLLGPIEVSAAAAGAVALALLAVMWLLASHPERVETLVWMASRLLPKPMAQRLVRLVSTFSMGFAVTRDPKGLLWSVLWSVPLWIVIAAEAWVVTIAFGIDMPFTGAFLLQALLVIGVAVPTPAAVGGFHEAYRIGVTTFFGAPNDQAVAAGIVVHAIAYIPVVLIGIVLMAQDGLSFGRLHEFAGAARHKELAPTDEVPILRSSGR